MKKSSLGKRKTSVPPRRLSSLGGFGDPSEPGTKNSQGHKKSLIPRPSRTRSSSADRDVANPSTLHKSRSHTQLSTLGMASTTPITPGFMVVPSGSCSSVRSYMNFGATQSSRPIKDTRPISEKQYQNKTVQKIVAYFNSIPDQNISTALVKRSLTIKLFVDAVVQLLSPFFKTLVLNMSNYSEEIPRLAKKLGYPGTVKKSWLVTANSSYSWLNVIALLSWLVDLHGVNSHIRELMFPPRDDDDDDLPMNILDDSTMFDYYMKSFDLYNKAASSEVIDTQFNRDMSAKIGISNTDIEDLEADIQKLNVELADPEQIAEEQEEDEKLNELSELENKEKLLAMTKLNRDNYRKELEKTKVALLQSIQTLNTHKQNTLSNISRLSDLVKNQRISMEDKRKIEADIMELENTNIELQNQFDLWSKKVYSDDLQIAKLSSDLNNRKTKHEELLLEHASTIPELSDFRVTVTYFQNGSLEIVKELCEQMKNLIAVLELKISQAEDCIEECDESDNDQTSEIKEVYQRIKNEAETEKVEATQLKEQLKQKQQELKNEQLRLQNETTRLKKTEAKKNEDTAKTRDIKLQIFDMHERATKFFDEMEAMHNEVIKKMEATMAPVYKLAETYMNKK
ncbi:kinetochore protein NDC80 homolog [Periplaneta americana]|uniref:kinetochore protein NDC80 homolog n=1 Tax=Periplaneta americana TaxID=6978 RepID=UPI0037E957FB